MDSASVEGCRGGRAEETAENIRSDRFAIAPSILLLDEKESPVSPSSVPLAVDAGLILVGLFLLRDRPHIFFLVLEGVEDDD